MSSDTTTVRDVQTQKTKTVLFHQHAFFSLCLYYLNFKKKSFGAQTPASIKIYKYMYIFLQIECRDLVLTRRFLLQTDRETALAGSHTLAMSAQSRGIICSCHFFSV